MLYPVIHGFSLRFRLVLGGLIFKVYPVQIAKAGFSDHLSETQIEPTYVYLKVGESITEAFGRYGALIDQL